ncbi:MAG: hypothetical protein KBI44_10930 [Thermoanaerobaculia bacterium]|nr:hypothetical protein [Thermoanaerobaculia bacterium]
MSEVSTFRLYLLRGTYLLIVVGLGLVIWPTLLHPVKAWTLWHSVGRSLLAAVTVLAALGIRYPLRLLPLLLFELVWKSIWLSAIALPLWLSGNPIDPAMQETIRDCLLGLVIFPAVIPWPYVLAEFVRKPGDRWRA